jgi:hypothetical protein
MTAGDDNLADRKMACTINGVAEKVWDVPLGFPCIGLKWLTALESLFDPVFSLINNLSSDVGW